MSYNYDKDTYGTEMTTLTTSVHQQPPPLSVRKYENINFRNPISLERILGFLFLLSAFMYLLCVLWTLSPLCLLYPRPFSLFIGTRTKRTVTLINAQCALHTVWSKYQF